MTPFAISLALALSAPADLPQSFEIALGSAGLSTANARFDAGMLSFYREGDFGLSTYDDALRNPYRLPDLSDLQRRQLLVTDGRPLDTVSFAGRLVDAGSRRELLGDPIATARARAGQPDPLTLVLAEYRRRNLITGNVPPVSSLPAEVAKAAAVVLWTALDAHRYRTAAFVELGDLPGAYAREMAAPAPYDPVSAARLRGLYRRVGINYLAAGGQDLASAVDQATSWVRTVSPSAAYDWRLSTPWGRIVLTGGTDSRHEASPTLLLIDTGGQDTYLNPSANLSVENWLSVSIDTNGNDSYISDSDLIGTEIAAWPERKNARVEPGPASAVFGYAFLTDTAGDDLYRTHRPGLGAARLGVAYLRDTDGDDAYDSYADSQGMARLGIGILEDTTGNDIYTCFTQSQGVGLTLGAGLLIDRSGDDRYRANNEILDFPSPQSAENNVSMAQGVGVGVRSDFLGGDSLAGGIGILFDAKGDDQYRCGVFGQGVGYWMGLGWLWDAEGNDTYSGQWYVQGAAAHFAVGMLEDGSGRDNYGALLNMAQGAGHDFSVGMLCDWSGNDIYTAPNLSLGAGNANGIGVFIDQEGDDQYNSRGISLGQSGEAPAGSLREKAITLGLFLDLGGADTFPAAFNYAQDGSRRANFARRGNPIEESQLGIFWAR